MPKPLDSSVHAPLQHPGGGVKTVVSSVYIEKSVSVGGSSKVFKGKGFFRDIKDRSSVDVFVDDVVALIVANQG